MSHGWFRPTSFKSYWVKNTFASREHEIEEGKSYSLKTDNAMRICTLFMEGLVFCMH